MDMLDTKPLTVADAFAHIEAWNCEDVTAIFEDVRMVVRRARLMDRAEGGQLLFALMDGLDKACPPHWPDDMGDFITYWAVDNQGRMIVSEDLFGEPRMLG